MTLKMAVGLVKTRFIVRQAHHERIFAVLTKIARRKKGAKILRSHKGLIFNWFRAGGKLSSGAVEWFNLKAKLAMRKACGFSVDRKPANCLISYTWQSARTGNNPQILLKSHFKEVNIFPENSHEKDQRKERWKRNHRYSNVTWLPLQVGSWVCLKCKTPNWDRPKKFERRSP